MPLQPFVRNMILCDEVSSDPKKPFRINLTGVLHSLRSSESALFPHVVSQICVYMVLSEVRASGRARIEIRLADDDRLVFSTSAHRIQPAQTPLEVIGLAFRLRNVVFEQPGFYWVEFSYNDEVLAYQPLLLR